MGESICWISLDWIDQSGLQSNLVDWIVIDNPKSKLDFPAFIFLVEIEIYFLRKLKFHSACLKQKKQAHLIPNFQKNLCILNCERIMYKFYLQK